MKSCFDSSFNVGRILIIILTFSFGSQCKSTSLRSGVTEGDLYGRIFFFKVCVSSGKKEKVNKKIFIVKNYRPYIYSFIYLTSFRWNRAQARTHFSVFYRPKTD